MSKENTTLVGGVGELKITIKLLELGFKVAAPVCAAFSYDLISDWNGKLKRIQIKVTQRRNSWNCYSVNSAKRRNSQQIPLTKEDCDILIAYVPDYDVSYIIPIEIINQVAVSLYPIKMPNEQFITPRHKGSNRYEVYKELWDILKT